MAITITVFIVLSIILFFFLNIAAREMFHRLKRAKKEAEWEEALAESLQLDFTRESKTLKRVELEEPEARILCVDDEASLLEAYRDVLGTTQPSTEDEIINRRRRRAHRCPLASDFSMNTVDIAVFPSCAALASAQGPGTSGSAATRKYRSSCSRSAGRGARRIILSPVIG